MPNIGAENEHELSANEKKEAPEPKERDYAKELDALRDSVLGAGKKVVAAEGSKIEAGVASYRGTAEDKAAVTAEVAPVEAEITAVEVSAETRAAEIAKDTAQPNHNQETAAPERGQGHASSEQKRTAAVEQRKKWLAGYTKNLDEIANSISAVLKKHTNFLGNVDMGKAGIELNRIAGRLRTLDRSSLELVRDPSYKDMPMLGIREADQLESVNPGGPAPQVKKKDLEYVLNLTNRVKSAVLERGAESNPFDALEQHEKLKQDRAA